MTSAHVQKRGDTYRVVAVYGGRGARREVVASGLTSRKEAERIAAAVAKRLQSRRAGVEDGTTVGELVAARTRRNKGKPSASVDAFAERHLAPLTDRAVAGLTTDGVQAWVDDLLEGGVGLEMTRRALGILRASIRRSPYRSSDPTAGVRLPAAPRRIRSTLSSDEVRAVLPHVADAFRPFFALSALLGTRPGELAALRETDLALEGRSPHVVLRKTVTREQTKTGADRIVPLIPEAVEWFRTALEATERDGGAVFPGVVRRQTERVQLSDVLRRAMRRAAVLDDVRSLVTGWRATCRRCSLRAELAEPGAALCPQCGFALWVEPELRPLRWYDLRATAATLLDEAGVPTHTVSRILGHSSTSTTRAHYIDSAAALGRLTLAPRKKGGRR